MSYLSEALYEAISARSRLMARLDSASSAPRISVQVLMNMSRHADEMLDIAMSDAVSSAVKKEMSRVEDPT